MVAPSGGHLPFPVLPPSSLRNTIRAPLVYYLNWIWCSLKIQCEEGSPTGHPLLHFSLCSVRATIYKAPEICIQALPWTPPPTTTPPSFAPGTRATCEPSAPSVRLVALAKWARWGGSVHLLLYFAMWHLRLKPEWLKHSYIFKYISFVFTQCFLMLTLITNHMLLKPWPLFQPILIPQWHTNFILCYDRAISEKKLTITLRGTI